MGERYQLWGKDTNFEVEEQEKLFFFLRQRDFSEWKKKVNGCPGAVQLEKGAHWGEMVDRRVQNLFSRRLGKSMGKGVRDKHRGLCTQYCKEDRL